MKYCDRCDGCGWHEGGAALQTTCDKCRGTGVIKDLFDPKSKPRRVIDQLRKKFPGKWTWEGPDVPYRWHNETMTVTAYSVLSPSYPDDDSTCRTEYLDQDGNVIILEQSFRTYRV